jgi:predicted ArsR family transcriptional regulator
MSESRIVQSEARTPAPVEPGPRDRGRALVRLLSELQLLQASRYGVTLVQLAAHLSVTERTVRRDLELLEEVNIPIVDELVPVEGRLYPERRWRVMSRELSDLRPAVGGGR